MRKYTVCFWFRGQKMEKTVLAGSEQNAIKLIKMALAGSKQNAIALKRKDIRVISIHVQAPGKEKKIVIHSALRYIYKIWKKLWGKTEKIKKKSLA